MKKIILILFLTLFAILAKGQTFHVNPGTSLSRLNWKYINGGSYEQQYDDPLLSYAFSLGADYSEHKYYSFGSDLLFYKSGGKYSSEELNTNFAFISPPTISVSYLSLGSSFNFIPINKKIRFQLSIGPRIDCIIGGSKNDPFNWIDKRKGLNKFNFGFTAGAGLYYNLKEFFFGVNMQYLNRLRELADLKSSSNSQITLGGVFATEQIFLMGFSFGYKIK